MTAKKPSTRNPYAPLARRRKAGKIRSRKDKRGNGKNKQAELLKEVENT